MCWFMYELPNKAVCKNEPVSCVPRTVNCIVNVLLV